MVVDKNLSKKLDKLIYLVSLKDQDAFKELYELTSSAVYGYALSILNNSEDAKDILQDTYVNIYGSSGNYISHNKPLAYILTITKNLCLLKFREDRKYQDLSFEQWDKQVYDNDSLSNEDKIFLYECLNKLNKEERQIVILHSLTGFKHIEISKLLKIPLSTVLSKYARAIKKLKKIGKESL